MIVPRREEETVFAATMNRTVVSPRPPGSTPSSIQGTSAPIDQLHVGSVVTVIVAEPPLAPKVVVEA
jgi:hypothetical protein